MTILRRMAVAGMAALGLAVGLTGCKVETSSETKPGAEGGESTTIRVSPMNREEVKDATERAIENTAAAAKNVKETAVEVGKDMKAAEGAIRARREGEAQPVAPAPAPAGEESTSATVE